MILFGAEDIRLKKDVKNLTEKVKNQEKRIQELEKNLQFLSICLRVHHNIVDRVEYNRIAEDILTEEELEILHGSEEY